MSRSLRLAALALALATAAVSPAAAKGLGIGRAATSDEIKGWDIDVRPDGQGLPPGKGTVAQGEVLFGERCASCHGDFGEGKDRWPEIAGGGGSLKGDNPVKTIGSYWPYAATVFDYVHRAMPFGNGQSLSADETYAVTAYLLSLNDVVKGDDFELNDKTLATVKLPNQDGFYMDDRETSEKEFWDPNPCMSNCASGPARITGRARAIDVTPDVGAAPKVQ